MSSCVFTLDYEEAIEMFLTSISQSKHAVWVCRTTNGMTGGHLGTILLASCTISGPEQSVTTIVNLVICQMPP